MDTATPTVQNPSAAPRKSSAARWPLFLIADLALVVIFAGIGRTAHGEDLSGLLSTAWPFLVGTIVGWLVARAWRSPAAIFPTGLIVWLGTEIVGMILRVLTHQGTAVSFTIVSLLVLAFFLLGYRLIVKAVTHGRRR